MNRSFKIGDVFYTEHTVTKVDENGNWLECADENIYDYITKDVSENVDVKMDFEKAYNEMVDENLLLKRQIRRYEEVVQALATINFTQGKQNNE